MKSRIFSTSSIACGVQATLATEKPLAALFSGGIPIAVHIIGLLNGLVSAVLLFLIIFAIRNRFRIG